MRKFLITVLLICSMSFLPPLMASVTVPKAIAVYVAYKYYKNRKAEKQEQKEKERDRKRNAYRQDPPTEEEIEECEKDGFEEEW